MCLFAGGCKLLPFIVGFDPLPYTPCAPPSGNSTVMTVSQMVENEFGFKYETRWRDYGILIMFVGLARFLTVFALRFINHLKR